jgi:hypothetical protein
LQIICILIFIFKSIGFSEHVALVEPKMKKMIAPMS